MYRNESLEQALSHVDVVSFDIFDTLLIRPYVDANDFYRVLGILKGRRSFSKRRIRAQVIAHKKHRESDPTLDDIYSLIPDFEDLKQWELELRTSTLLLNPELLKVLDYAVAQGKKIAIISDMYISSSYLKELLRQKGVSRWDGFYLSNEHNGRKSNGKLYDVFLKDFKVAPEKILHIGDNYRSDVLMANQKGIIAYYYPRVSDKFIGDNYFAQRYLRQHDSISRRCLIGALAAGWHCYQYANSELGYFERVGFLYGGVLGYAYASFVANEARRRGIKRLLLVYRDGYNLEPIFNKLYPDLKTTLIYAPRKTYFYASKDFTDKPHMIEARRKMVWRELSMSGNEQEFLKAGTLSKDNAVKFETASQRARTEYLLYIKSLGIDNPAEVALVDMTTSALSATRLIENTLGKTITSFYLLTYKPGLKKLPPSVVPMFHAHGSSIILTLMSEFLFTAPTPSVVGVENGQPIYDDAGGFFDKFKSGVCEVVRPAIVQGACALSDARVEISRGDLLDYFEAFHAAVTPRDESEFSFAREATGIEQREGRSPLQPELRCIRPVFRLFGRVVLSVRVWTRQMRRYVTFYFIGRVPILRIRLPF